MRSLRARARADEGACSGRGNQDVAPSPQARKFSDFDCKSLHFGPEIDATHDTIDSLYSSLGLLNFASEVAVSPSTQCGPWCSLPYTTGPGIVIGNQVGGGGEGGEGFMSWSTVIIHVTLPSLSCRRGAPPLRSLGPCVLRAAWVALLSIMCRSAARGPILISD